MMRHLFSDQVADFAAVYDADMELICVARPKDDSALTGAGTELLAQHKLKVQWSQSIDDTGKADEVLSAYLKPCESHALADEIYQAADMLGCLLDCKAVGIRIATLHAPMCPRFHVDKVPCRLLLTLSGTGTEWIANGDVDPEQFADRSCDSDPLKPGTTISQLPARHWSLLKGGAWEEGFDGVVHRSPRDAEARVLVSLDPLFNFA